MILPSNRVRILIATRPVDFRKGHNGLATLVKNELGQTTFTSRVFVFRPKRLDRLKLLYWDGSGLVMAYKHLEYHRFAWPLIKDGFHALGRGPVRSLVFRPRLAVDCGHGYGYAEGHKIA